VSYFFYHISLNKPCGLFSGSALDSELFEGVSYLRVHLIF